MKWVGLTGGIASGKSTAALIIRQNGVPVIDADEISRRLMLPHQAGYLATLHAFGPAILTPNKEIDRRHLGQIVFSEPTKRQLLESILHPLIQTEVRNQKQKLEAKGEAVAVYDIPLLFEKNLDAQYDRILLIAIDENRQRQRLQLRDNLTDDEITQRFKNQLPMSDKVARAHDVIWNHGDIKDLEKQIVSWVSEITKPIEGRPTQ